MRKASFLLIALLVSAVVGNAKVRLPQIFQSGMVLQRGTTVPVWGQADAGETVVVKLNKKTATAVADDNGKWRVNLPAMKAGGPYVMSIESKTNHTSHLSPLSSHIELSDVWLGDVWLCTGQSNMETTLERVSPQYPDELNDSNAMVRLFHVQYQTDTHGPSADLRPTSWKKLNRENAWRFSSIGYFLGKQLQREKGVTQGVIESAWGGTPIEAWIAADTLEKHFPLYYKQMQLYQNDEYVAAQQKAGAQAEQQWQIILNANDPGLRKYTELSYDD
jgi:sialate O-acetylesterase